MSNLADDFVVRAKIDPLIGSRLYLILALVCSTCTVTARNALCTETSSLQT